MGVYQKSVSAQRLGRASRLGPCLPLTIPLSARHVAFTTGVHQLSHTTIMTTRRTPASEKVVLENDPRGPPGPSNISPAVESYVTFFRTIRYRDTYNDLVPSSSS